MNCIIEFPVKNHIKKYLVFKYGQLYKYSSTSSLAILIRDTLSKESYYNLNKFKNTESYQIELNQPYISRYGVFFDENKLYQFNREVEHLFREELYQFMNFNKNIYKLKYRTSLRDFLKTMEITEEDIKIETLLRDFDRKHNKKINISA